MRSSSQATTSNAKPATAGRFSPAAALLAEAENLRVLLTWLPLWLLLALALAGQIIAYQTTHTYSIPVGSPGDQAYVRNFHGRLDDNGRPYRWSDVYGYIALPGLGGGRPFTVTLTLDPGRPAPVTVIVNGVPLYSKNTQPGWQIVSVAVDTRNPSALASRDTVIELRAPDYRLPDAPTEPKGVKVSSVVVEPASAGSFVAPSISRLALFEASLLLIYLFVGYALTGVLPRPRVRAWALLAGAIAAISLILWLASSHIAAGGAAPHIAVTAGSALVLLLGGELLAKRLAVNSTLVQRRVLGVTLAMAFALRYGGMALPQSVIIDMPWHMKWLTTLLAGNWQSLYFPGELSSVPREWGLSVLIPKSPLFYFVAAPFSTLPLDLETLVKWLICFIDCTLVLAVFVLARRLRAGISPALYASGLYAVMPLIFRAFAYGILPTIFAQWLATGALLFSLGATRSKWGIGRWLLYILLTVLSLLAFPTVAVFLSIVMVASAIIWVVPVAGVRLSARAGLRLVGALVLAWLLAVWAYYGLYIGLVASSVSALLTTKSGAGTTVRWPGGWPDLIAWTADYIVTLLPVLLALTGLLLLIARLKHKSVAARQTVWLLIAWAAIAPVFFIANYRVDMIGKHLFFTMIPVAAAGGVALWQLGRRGRWGYAFVALLFGTVAWQALVFWIDRLARAST